VDCDYACAGGDGDGSGGCVDGFDKTAYSATLPIDLFGLLVLGESGLLHGYEGGRRRGGSIGRGMNDGEDAIADGDAAERNGSGSGERFGSGLGFEYARIVADGEGNGRARVRLDGE
jgi:hypothetical protein